MRRLTCVVFAVCAFGFVAAHATAQTTEVGFKLGPSFATLSGAEDAIRGDFDEPGVNVRSTTRTGLAASGFLRFGFGPASLQTELAYVQKGGGGEATEPGVGSVEIGVEVDYVEVPVLLRVALPAGMLLRPFVYAGPAASFEVSCALRVELLGVSATEDCGDDFDRRTLDFGMIFGGGVGVPVGVGRILLEARYNVGLTNLNDSPDGDDVDLKNRALNVFAGFSIPLR